MMDAVKLTNAEKEMCAMVGRWRFDDAMANRRNAGRGPSRDLAEADNHIRGAECEFSASIMLNLYWRPSVGIIKDKDVGGVVEVRSTVIPSGRLIIKPADKDRSPFVLIWKKSENDFSLLGWIMAGDAKKMTVATKDHGDEAHFVTQHQLRDSNELRIFIAQKTIRDLR